MATATVPLPQRAPGPHRWTVDEYHRALFSGLWEGKKIILIDGELVEMPAPKPPHDIALALADYLFKALFGNGYVVRIQLGMVFNINTDPLPDLAVVPGTPRTMVSTPATAELVLEVSDTTLDYDTGPKADLYVAAGIADYWVIDVTGRRLIVHRDPRPNTAAKYGQRYASVTSWLPGQSVAPLALPQSPVAAVELLP